MLLDPSHAQPAAAPAAAASAPDDPFLWLEDVTGDKALAWVRARNAESQKVLQARPEYAPAREKILDILNSKDKIPTVRRIGGYLYNLWQDEQHKRGLWRRTTLDEYRKRAPQWDTVIDLDALGKAENENWVWAGASCLGPQYTRCMVSLSRGGSDAKVTREFDLTTKQFVAGGFTLPEAKSETDWLDRDTLLVATDFGAGSLTDSGYPRVIKRWARGTPLADAQTLYEAKPQDVSSFMAVDLTPGFVRTLLGRAIDFYNDETYLLQGGKLVKIDKPSDAAFTPFKQWALLKLRSDWAVGGRTYKAGSLLIEPFDAYMSGERRFDVLFEPTATTSLSSMVFTRNAIVLDVLDNVASRLEEWRREGDAWVRRAVKAPFPGTLGIAGLYDPVLGADPLGDHYLVNYTDFLTPDSLYLATAGSDARELLKQRPTYFNAQGMRTEQRFAVSKDGTRVPYFIVWPKGAKADGDNPTLLYGYGGFQISEQPFYSGAFGNAWYARGGVFVLANIRGGGEFGPQWHQAAVKAHKQRSYDDFAAVAQDLIKQRVTSPRHLGIMGGSNGGLLVGATFVEHPELFNAVVCQVPLLDMRRYNKLLAGASWMAEYGDPDRPDEWAYISKYSPYQNVKPGVKYPRVLFTTSTRDDRVHPGHARKMAARMLAQGHDVLYYENIEGGHGGAADNEQRAHLAALEFAYLWMQLGRH
ncbi:MAG: S9 family peptidase [Betaproteobacteria bacterium]|nr:S9 family peptidase [Betaproteobacteria bacterium]